MSDICLSHTISFVYVRSSRVQSCNQSDGMRPTSHPHLRRAYGNGVSVFTSVGQMLVARALRMYVATFFASALLTEIIQTYRTQLVAGDPIHSHRTGRRTRHRRRNRSHPCRASRNPIR